MYKFSFWNQKQNCKFWKHFSEWNTGFKRNASEVLTRVPWSRKATSGFPASLDFLSHLMSTPSRCLTPGEQKEEDISRVSTWRTLKLEVVYPGESLGNQAKPALKSVEKERQGAETANSSSFILWRYSFWPRTSPHKIVSSYKADKTRAGKSNFSFIVACRGWSFLSTWLSGRY